MLYMLDTDICSYMMRRKMPGLVERFQKAREAGDTIGISVIAYGEMRLGAERSGAPGRYHHQLNALSDRLDYIADWASHHADRFAVLHANLLSEGRTIGINDTMIAAHALYLGATLITHDERHFGRIEALQFENWTKG